MNESQSELEELSPDACWALLRQQQVGRLAVWIEDHPEIFPLNYAVDHGSLVFRTAAGTKVAGALSETPVALEIDGLDAGGAPDRNTAFSVVVKGQAEQLTGTDDLMDTVDLPLTPWQPGAKEIFIRVHAEQVTGRRFPVASPEAWKNELSDVPRTMTE